MLRKLSFLVLGLGFQTAGLAAVPDYNMHCELSGKAVEMADETIPAKEKVGDKKFAVNLHLKNIPGSEFHTTGADYYAKLRLKTHTISIYLHASGYGFPLDKTVGVSVRENNANLVRLFSAEVPDRGNTVVEPAVLRLIGVPGIPEFDTALSIVCNDYGSE